MTQIIQMQNYDLDYHPAMPIIEIGLSKPEDMQPSLFLTAIIDTGADATIIPLRVLKKMAAISVDDTYLKGITGSRRRVKLYAVSVYIGEHRVYVSRVIADAKNDEIIIGRDVLNQLEVTLNGFAEVTEIRS